MQKICLLLALVASVFAAPEMDEGVIVLTDANFDEVIAEHDNLLVEFYAPWCGHCKKLAPEYSAAAKVLAENDPPFFLAKVDATEQTVLGDKFGIQGFPTMKFFKKGVPMEYMGGRTKDTIIDYVLKKSGPASAEVTCDALKTKVAENKGFLLAYFGAADETLFIDGHMALADTQEKMNFVHVNDAACATEHGAAFPGETFFRTFEETTVQYVGEPDKDSILKFIQPLMVPTLFEFSEDQVEAVFAQQQNLMILFRGPADADAAFMTVLADAAKVNKGKILFAYSDITAGIQEKLAEFMGVTAADLPVLKSITPESMNKYQSEVKCADLTVETITKFADDVVSGALKPALKSAPIPEDNTAGVTIVVGEEFEKIVKNPEADVLVKYYAPWCGHCKKLAPIWDELGEAFKDEPNVVIAKFDATTNEAEGLQIRGYPTLMFYPKDNKEGITYSGERDLESFKTWMNENSSVIKDKAASTSQHEEL